MLFRVGEILHSLIDGTIGKRDDASALTRKLSALMRSYASCHTIEPNKLPIPRCGLVLQALLAQGMILLGFATPANAQPVNLASARGAYTGGGLTISTADLQRLAAGLSPHNVHFQNEETAASQRVQPENPDSTSTTPRLGSSPTIPPLPPSPTPRGGSGRVLLVECNGAYGYATIQSAIDDAVDGDVVVVLPNDCTPEGRWFENINFLGKAIRVQSANPQDEAVVDATVIDGDANGTVVTFKNGEGLDSVLDGLVLTNGLAQFGGGFQFISSAATIRRCRINQNTSEIRGGAVYVSFSPKSVFDTCKFDANVSLMGDSLINASGTVVPDLLNCEVTNHSGDIMVTGNAFNILCGETGACTQITNSVFSGNSATSTFLASYLAFDNCLFENNSSTWINGGNLSFVDCVFMNSDRFGIDGFDLSFTNCHFEENGDELASGIRVRRNASFVSCSFYFNQVPGPLIRLDAVENTLSEVRNCIFASNNAFSIVYAFVAQPSPALLIENSEFIGNRVVSGAGTVQVIASFGEAIVSKSRFESNSGEESSNDGGSSIVAYGEVTIRDSIVSGGRTGSNSPAVRGVMSTHGAIPHLQNSTIIGNASNGPTGGVENVTLENCILYNNRGAGGVEDQTAQLAPGTVANFCNIQNFSGLLTEQGAPMASVGNLDLDPRFVDPGVWDDMGTPADTSDDIFIPGDYHLLLDSPCIDAGNPEFLPDDEATDIDGEARLQSCRVDIGADEFTQDDVAVPGDFDGDGLVSLADVPEFLSVALGPVGSQVCQGDLTGDGRFDGRDIAALTALLIGN